MVLAQRVGRPRSFWAGLALTVVTFGIYAVYWNYKVHNEVYRQFELARENRDEGMVWYVLGLVVPPFLLAYFWVMAANVTYVRDRIGLARRWSPGRFVGVIGAGVGVFVVGVVLLEAALATLGAEPDEGAIDAALAETGPIFLACAAIAAVVLAIAYAGLQRDLNEVWAAYDARLSYLRANPQPPGPLVGPVGGSLFERVALPAGGPMAAPPPSGYSYYADLAPPAPAAPPAPPAEDPAAPLREAWARVKAEAPGVPTADVEDLLAAASRGDPYARERAEAVLREHRALLDERRGLQARRLSLVGALRALDERLASGQVDASVHEAETSALERDLAAVRTRLEAVEARLFGAR